MNKTKNKNTTFLVLPFLSETRRLLVPPLTEHVCVCVFKDEHYPYNRFGCFEVCPFGGNVFSIKVQRRRVLSFSVKKAQRASPYHLSLCHFPMLDSIISRSSFLSFFLSHHIWVISNTFLSKHPACFTIFPLFHIFISFLSLCLLSPCPTLPPSSISSPSVVDWPWVTEKMTKCERFPRGFKWQQQVEQSSRWWLLFALPQGSKLLGLVRI